MNPRVFVIWPGVCWLVRVCVIAYERIRARVCVSLCVSVGACMRVPAIVGTLMHTRARFRPSYVAFFAVAGAREGCRRRGESPPVACRASRAASPPNRPHTPSCSYAPGARVPARTRGVGRLRTQFWAARPMRPSACKFGSIVSIFIFVCFQGVMILGDCMRRAGLCTSCVQAEAALKAVDSSAAQVRQLKHDAQHTHTKTSTTANTRTHACTHTSKHAHTHANTHANRTHKRTQ
jgi:hypothetical protein